MRSNKRVVKRAIAGAIVLAMGVTTLFASANTSYAAGEAKLNKTSRNILTRKSYDFDVTGAPSDAVITWKSSDEAVATVDKDGVVTGVTKGTATITCEVTSAGKTQTLTAKVSIRKPAVKIEIKNKITELEYGKTYDLNRNLTPKTSNDVTTWKSSNTKIATVDANGVVKALKDGTVTITATTMSGRTDSVEITVFGAPKPTATPAPTKKPDATATPVPTKPTTAPAKPTQAPAAQTENKTFTFAQMTQPADKGTNWACQTAVNGGKLTMTSDAGAMYTQSFWMFPDGVDMKNVEKITFNGVKGAGVEFRLMTAAEYTAYDGSQNAGFQGSETVFETKGAPLAYFIVVSKDGSQIAIDSVTFTVKAAAEKPSASKYTFAQITQPEDKGKNWACQTAVNGGKLTMTSDAGAMYTQSFWQIPDGVDMKNVKKVTFNGVTGAGVEFRLMTAAEYTAYDGSQNAGFQSSETVFETKGAPIAYFIVVSKDGSKITIDSVSFE